MDLTTDPWYIDHPDVDPCNGDTHYDDQWLLHLPMGHLFTDDVPNVLIPLIVDYSFGWEVYGIFCRMLDGEFDAY